MVKSAVIHRPETYLQLFHNLESYPQVFHRLWISCGYLVGKISQAKPQAAKHCSEIKGKTQLELKVNWRSATESQLEVEPNWR